MIHMIAYLIFSYLVVLLFIVRISTLLVPKLKRSKFRMMIAVIILLFAFLLLAPLIPYFLVEHRTQKYGMEFHILLYDAVKSLNYDTHPIIRDFKVLSISNLTASVYVVSSCQGDNRFYDPGYAGSILYFVKEDGIWRYSGKEYIIWSDCGSANGNIFPPYPCKGEYQ